MVPTGVTRADMHCHSSASQAAKLAVQRSAGLPECATPPEEVYSLAKRRGMDFVTITDHDTIDGCLEIADRPDVFISEELTTWFAGERQAVHVLCYGITPADHEFLQANARDLEDCAGYLRAREITCALAHPFFSVAAPLRSRHRRRLAELFDVWEVRNGSRARELNMPAAVYIETQGGKGIGGSDDHAGVDIGRTFTEVPSASTPEEFLRHVREGRVEIRGAQGSAAKWAHSALALAARTLMAEEVGDAVRDERAVNRDRPIDPSIVFELVQQVVADGEARGGESEGAFGPSETLALLRGWLAAVELPLERDALLAVLQADDFSHTDLARRARRVHEKGMRSVVSAVAVPGADLSRFAPAAEGLFAACLPTLPYVPAATILGRERAKLVRGDEEPRRAALVVDGIAAVHGVAHTIERIREHGVPGWEVEVIGTDASVDRRLPAVAEVEIPLLAGLGIGVPSVPELVETLAEGRYDLIHLVSPGPSGLGAALSARIGGIPLVGSYHTELAAYVGLRSQSSQLEAITRTALSVFYGACKVVLSPSPSADASLLELGILAERLHRWGRGVDLKLLNPAKRDPDEFPGEVKVLYAGRLTAEKGVDLLAESFLRARERDPRLHLLLAGDGPEAPLLRHRLGAAATFLGWLDREQLAGAYASSDIFLFTSSTDTYGQVVVEAQASGLPVVAVAAGGPLSLISDRRTGWLCDPDADQLAAAVAQLAASPFLRERIARTARAELHGRSWEASFAQLAGGYGRAAGPDRVEAERRRKSTTGARIEAA